MFASCPDGVGRCRQALGSAGEPCKPDNSCDAGLSCVGEGCPGSAGIPRPCCVETGGLDEPRSPISASGECDSGQGLSCVTGPPGFCPNGGTRCCKKTGGPNEPCDAKGQCTGSLVCMPSPSCLNPGGRARRRGRDTEPRSRYPEQIMGRRHNRQSTPPAALEFDSERTLADAEEDRESVDSAGDEQCPCGSTRFLLEGYFGVEAGRVSAKALELGSLTCPECGREFEAIEAEDGRVLRGELQGRVDLDEE
jgi:hypothetical protein